MTHEELLARIDWVGNNLNGNATYSSLVMASVNSLNALRAVVELHKPAMAGSFTNNGCLCMLPNQKCPTIQAIEKELK